MHVRCTCRNSRVHSCDGQFSMWPLPKYTTHNVYRILTFFKTFVFTCWICFSSYVSSLDTCTLISFLYVSLTCLYHSHFCMTYMAVSLTYLYHSHVCITHMAVSLTCLYHSHVCITHMSVWLTWLYHSHVCITHMSVWLTCLYDSHVYKWRLSPYLSLQLM